MPCNTPIIAGNFGFTCRYECIVKLQALFFANQRVISSILGAMLNTGTHFLSLSLRHNKHISLIQKLGKLFYVLLLEPTVFVCCCGDLVVLTMLFCCFYLLASFYNKIFLVVGCVVELPTKIHLRPEISDSQKK